MTGTNRKENLFVKAWLSVGPVVALFVIASIIAFFCVRTYSIAGDLPSGKQRTAPEPKHAIEQPAAVELGVKYRPASSNASLSITPNLSNTETKDDSPKEKPDKEKLEERVKDIESMQRAIYSSWLDGQRKTIDWWLAFLAVMMAVVALFSAIIPFFMAQKDKQILKELISRASEDSEKIKLQLTGDVRIAQDAAGTAQRILEDILRYKDEAKANSETIKEYGKTFGDMTKKKGESKEEDLKNTGLDEKVESQHAQQTLITPLLSDYNSNTTEFKKGYNAQKQYKEVAPAGSRLEWFTKLVFHYKNALILDSNVSAAAHNLADAYDDEARIIVQENLTAGLIYWNDACEKYDLALKLDPKDSIAANNWGCALSDMAKAIFEKNMERAEYFWDDAFEKFLMANKISPAYVAPVVNWAITLGEMAKLRYSQDESLGIQTWRSALDKFDEALTIDAEFDGAYLYKVMTMLEERYFIVSREPERAKELLHDAKKLLIEKAEAKPEIIAFNLARCFALEANVEDALKWLKTAHITSSHATFKSDVLDQVDFDLIRNTPLFRSWFESLPD